MILLKKDIERISLSKSIGLILLLLVIVYYFYYFNSESTLIPKQNDSKIEGNLKGNENATVKIIEWSDFECPYCVRFSRDTYPELVEKLIETGDAKLIFKHYPLNFHKNAQKAAEATECAADQEMFWEMHDKIFNEGIGDGVQTYKEYASSLNLNLEEFNDCLDSGIKFNKVQDDMKEGDKLGIKGTPGFLVNGRIISGACSFEVFEKAVNAEKENKNWVVERCVFKLK